MTFLFPWIYSPFAVGLPSSLLPSSVNQPPCDLLSYDLLFTIFYTPLVTSPSKLSTKALTFEPSPISRPFFSWK